jgi:PAS domain-containing protein
VNQAVADAYGTTVEDLIGKTDADFNPNREEVEFFHRMDLEVMDTLKERFIPEEHLTDAQGEVRWLQTVKRPNLDKMALRIKFWARPPTSPCANRRNLNFSATARTCPCDPYLHHG